MRQFCSESQSGFATCDPHRLSISFYAGLEVALEAIVQQYPVSMQVHQTTTLLMWICRLPAQALMPTQQQKKGIWGTISKPVLLGRQAMVLGRSEEQQRRQQKPMQKACLPNLSRGQRKCQNSYTEQASLSTSLLPQSVDEV